VVFELFFMSQSNMCYISKYNLYVRYTVRRMYRCLTLLVSTIDNRRHLESIYLSLFLFFDLCSTLSKCSLKTPKDTPPHRHSAPNTCEIKRNILLLFSGIY